MKEKNKNYLAILQLVLVPEVEPPDTPEDRAKMLRDNTVTALVQTFNGNLNGVMASLKLKGFHEVPKEQLEKEEKSKH